MAKLSIGIPTYNQGSTIEQSILSAINQTTPAYEIVVCNNYSTDETASILKKYEGQIKVIEPPKFLPMSENWDFLVRNLTGDWFSLISSDDIYESDFVETFERNVREDTVLMRFNFNRIDGEGKIVQKDVGIRSARSIQSFPGNFIEEMSCPKISFAAFAIKLSAFKEIGYFDLSIERCGDWATWVRLSPMGKYHYIRKTVSNYRVNYREGQTEKYLHVDTNDIEKIIKLEDDIIGRFNIKPFFREKTRAIVAERRYKLHKLFADDAEVVLERFGVTHAQINSISKLDRMLIWLNETFLKK